MKIDFINNISFEKKLKAYCSVLRQGYNIPCAIYQLEYDKDKNYFNDIKRTKKGWIDSLYWNNMIFNPTGHNDYDFFVMEDTDETCLGYMKVIHRNNDNEKSENVLFVETNPNARKKNYKYIAESLFSFLANQSKRKHVKQINALFVAESAIGFYKKLNFKEEDVNMVLDESEFDSLIERNKQHTNCSIRYIG